MNGALPPGAWWEYASSGQPPPPAEPYGVYAGDTPLNKEVGGASPLRKLCCFGLAMQDEEFRS